MQLLADVVWPALYVAGASWTWWVVVAGLAIEFFFVRLFFPFGTLKAVVVDLTMNAVSGLLGIVLVPAFGIAWEIFPGVALYKIFNVGTFNPGTWVATFIGAALISAGVESLVVRFAFSTRLTRRQCAALCMANALSVGLAFAALWFAPTLG